MSERAILTFISSPLSRRLHPSANLIQQVKLIITSSLFENILYVLVDGPFGDIQGIADFFVDVANPDQLAYLNFSFGKSHAFASDGKNLLLIFGLDQVQRFQILAVFLNHIPEKKKGDDQESAVGKEHLCKLGYLQVGQ